MNANKKIDDITLDTPEVMTSEEFAEFQKSEHVRVINRKNGEIKRFTCAGIDVHKKVLVVAVCVTDKDTLVPTYYVYKTYAHNKRLIKMCKWLKSYNVTDVCMESTGKYWIPVYNFLDRHGFNPVISHPKYLKSPRGKKNDVQDAMHIANAFRMDIVKPSFIPPMEIRDIRNLCRYSVKLTCARTAEKNRYQNNLQECNLRLDTVFTDVFGKSSQAIMRQLMLNGPDNLDREQLKASLDKHCKSSVDDILDAIRGGEFIGSQQELILLHKQHIDDIDYLLGEIQLCLDNYIIKYEKQVDHLCSMVGVSKNAAIFILGEIGTDMSVWEDADCLCSWAGVVPASNSSAGKNKSVKIGTGGLYLKPILVECVNAAIKSNRDPYFAIKYNGIKGRRGHKKAVIAIAHKMLICIYHMLKDDVDFKPSDYDAVIGGYNKAHSKKIIRLDEVFEILKANGAEEDTLEKLKDQCRMNLNNSGSQADGAADKPDKANAGKKGSSKKSKTVRKTRSAKTGGTDGTTDSSEKAATARKPASTRKTSPAKKAKAADEADPSKEAGTTRKPATARKTSPARKKAPAVETKPSEEAGGAAPKKTTRSRRKDMTATVA